MGQPEITVLVSSYERPGHLERCLLSLALQRDVAGKMEVIVTDDGSPEVNLPVTEAFASQVDFPVHFTTHVHADFRLARCRNEGIAASTAPYLLITDGDCLLPPDHLKWHLEYRRSGRVVLGDCYRLDAHTSDRITESVVRSGEYLAWVSPSERRRMAGKAFRAWWYHRLHCTMLPRMTGNNIGIWRTDLERVNGFDENYVGWGLEDRDLQRRLSRLGLQFQSILGRTAPCHLWHPRAPSFARNNVMTKNLAYFERPQIATRCPNGLAQRIAASRTIELRHPAVAAPAGAPASDFSNEEQDVVDTLPFLHKTTCAIHSKAA